MAGGPSRPAPVLHSAPFAALTPEQLYGILRLRVDVFVVEQACAYPELDGRDHEPGARHLWHESGGSVVSTARLLEETAGGSPVGRIGRIATAVEHRGRGLAAELVEAGVAYFAGRAVVLGAQARLERWYVGLGFVVNGPGYDEDGIPHLPMRRAAR